MARLSPPALPPLWLLAAATWVGPFSIHIVIPSMPILAAEFATDNAGAQATLTAYLVGISIGQLIHGPLSDRIGRRPALLAGLAVYGLATVGCALAWSISSLVALRALQGLGGCAGQVLGRAIIRDCVGRDRAGSLIGYVTVIMASGSAFSPLIAGLVDAGFGWRANFAWLAVAAACFAWATWRLLGETRDAAAAPAGARALLAGGWVLLRDPAYLGYALSTAFAMAVWYGFVAGAPFVLHAQLGLPTTAYGAWILLVLAGYVFGNFLAGRFSVRLGGARMIALGQAIALAGAAVQLGVLAAGVLTPLALFLPMTLVIFASGLFLPNLNAFAISVRPELAGSASGLIGFLQMTFSALATVAMGRWLEASEAPLIALTAGGSLASAAALALVRARR